MQHLVNISFAPVIVVMDDRGNPLGATIIGPASWLFYLPGLLCIALGQVWLCLNACLTTGSALRDVLFGPGWPADLALMAEASRLLLAGRWLFLAGRDMARG